MKLKNDSQDKIHLNILKEKSLFMRYFKHILAIKS